MIVMDISIKFIVDDSSKKLRKYMLFFLHHILAAVTGQGSVNKSTMKNKYLKLDSPTFSVICDRQADTLLIISG